jgi:hypothetical protein
MTVSPEEATDWAFMMVASGLAAEPLLLSLPVGDRNQVAAKADEPWSVRLKAATAKILPRSPHFEEILDIKPFLWEKMENFNFRLNSARSGLSFWPRLAKQDPTKLNPAVEWFYSIQIKKVLGFVRKNGGRLK